MNNKKLIDILEMHDLATENYGLAPEVTSEEFYEMVAAHSVQVPEITEEEFEEQKKAA